MASRLADRLLNAVVSGAKAELNPYNEFDPYNQEVVDWAKDHAAELIVDILKDTRDAINLVVRDGLANEIATKNIAKMVKSTIGLTERGAQAVMNLQLRLLERGVKPDVATARAEKYGRKLVKSRANTIAQTETMRAVNEGQNQSWKQAQYAGLLGPREKKVWITYDPCPLCAGMSGETVGINESFSIGGNPPLHPNCRCTIALLGGDSNESR